MRLISPHAPGDVRIMRFLLKKQNTLDPDSLSGDSSERECLFSRHLDSKNYEPISTVIFFFFMCLFGIYSLVSSPKCALIGLCALLVFY